MNATQWDTLGSFVQYLGRTGKCVVDETDKGWHLQFVDRDPRAVARRQELERKRKAELDHDERHRRFLERQLEVAAGKAADSQQRPTKLLRADAGEKIKMAIGAKASAKKEAALAGGEKAAAFGGADGSAEQQQRREPREDGKPSAVDAIMQEEERRRQQRRRRLEDEARRQRKENWVAPGIVVKVTNKKVGDGRYYKRKAAVKQVEDKFCATVELLDSGDVLRLDQDDLETVIPKPGRMVKVVNGLGRGCVAKLLDISVDDYCARIRIDSGSHKGEVLDRVEYEDICRLADE
ncbi:unnamed protein product [Phytophthora fragariaefolia]|uniref:Unnamed protein product n=1 Tax=Phytophthora fragariaefolia TaxID=1490495 RepID=A0A9W7D6Q2_9STRA|nr:unnamed protein product [Phytophthora fragariaefolia]